MPALALLVAAIPSPGQAAGSSDQVLRQVHGRIEVPTGTLVGTPAVNATVRRDTAHLKCVLPDAGVEGTAVLVDGVVTGREFELVADTATWQDDFDVAFFDSMAAAQAACDGDTPVAGLPHKNHAGDEHAVVPERAAVALVTLVTGTPGAGFTYRELERKKVRFRSPGKRRPTVVAVLEPGGFSPYHFDFVGHQHPWNVDDNPDNDLDFSADPKGWLPSYPGAEPVHLSIPGPTEGEKDISCIAGCTSFELGPVLTFHEGPDTRTWASMRPSSLEEPHLYRFPGTKVIGAIRFGADNDSTALCQPTAVDPAKTVGCEVGHGRFYEGPNSHGTRSASVAGGNIYGTCAECVFVFVTYDGNTGVDGKSGDALEWLAKQSWIDVVTNSWAMKTYAWPSAHAARVTRPATERGQTFLWGSGNGVDGAFVAPNQTYGWGYHAADWGVTVGGVSDPNQQSMNGGRPVDIASYASEYPAAGDSTPTGRGAHTGTSNATPVVAGTFAKVIQWGRDLLGDTTPGHHAGIVDGRPQGILAQGRPRPCDGPLADCPLADGILTRAEVQSIVFGNVLPSAPRPNTDPLKRVTPLNQDVAFGLVAIPGSPSYTTQGHGIVYGRQDPARFAIEQRRFLDALRGAVGPYQRPPGERAWMTADSKCRQRMWGSWNGGYYTAGTEPSFDPTTDQPAIALYSACTAVPPGALAHDLPSL